MSSSNIKLEKIDPEEEISKLRAEIESSLLESKKAKEKIKIESTAGVNVNEGTRKTTKEKIHFVCEDCGLTEEADFYGKKPPFCRTVIFHEDSYICRDPFSPQASNTANFLLLGSNCAVCGNMTCQDCSVFYNVRFCAKCSKAAQQKLPQQLKITKVNKD